MATEVVACKIYQHDVLRVLLDVVGQAPSGFKVCGIVSGAGERARNGVDLRFAAFHHQLGLGRRTEDAEVPKVKVE